MNKKGFTLVELLAVIAILAILVIIALPNVLKMFNDAKKNSFITETKTIYSEVSKKYISESMKGNKLTYVSSEDNTKLNMTGRDLQYCVLLNSDGSVKSMKVSNGEWVAELSDNKNIADLKSSDLKDGNLDNEECGSKKPKNFAEDDWYTIASVAKSCVSDPDSCPYSVGNEKEVKLKKYGTHKVRIANLSSPTEEGCGTNGFSESACGFVIEFADIITNHNMKTSNTNIGGWPGSTMHPFLNDENLDGLNGKELSIMKALPDDLKSVIIDTKTVSGSGYEDTGNFTSPDKLYLLAPKEIYSDWSDEIPYDSAADFTRQLDYYKGVTTKNFTKATKNISGGSASYWWLRSANSHYGYDFYSISDNGDWDPGNATASTARGVSPAFKIG
ncbi:MAG: DUF6273 domain-containing protein [Clostridium sp.]|nr:DUF6273 domain-containing protein [Clostridium sp.]